MFCFDDNFIIGYQENNSNFSDYKNIIMEVSCGSTGHLGHGHGGGTSNLNISFNTSGTGMSGPNEGIYILWININD